MTRNIHSGTCPHPLILNDADDDKTPHWKYRVDFRDVWSAESFPTYEEARAARVEAIRKEIAARP